MFRISLSCTLSIMGLLSLMAISQTSAQTLDSCITKVCDAECKSYFVANRAEIINSFVNGSTMEFQGICGTMAKPEERRQCYMENLADKEGFKPKASEMDNWAYRKFVESGWNPTAAKCIKKINDDYTAAQWEENRKRGEEARAKYDHAPQPAPAPSPAPAPKAKTSSKAKSEPVEESSDAQADLEAKNAELDRISAANQAALEQQQREQDKQRQEEQELRNRQVDAMNKQAELDFAAKGVGSDMLQHGFRSILEGALNK